MKRPEIEAKLRALVEHAWDSDIRWPAIEAWANNFKGEVYTATDEQLYALFTLTRFMYFSKTLLRQMLYSLYEEHFKAPLMQRIRRNYGNTKDLNLLNALYQKELNSTRFVGVGNPAESGAHLLYYFRQVNYLPKNLFVDIAAAFLPTTEKSSKKISYVQRDSTVNRYVFFDDIVGSGDQASQYLADTLKNIRSANQSLDLRFMSLFSTSQGLERLSKPSLFDNKATCLFELDNSFKVFDKASRYFNDSPVWFDKNELEQVCSTYGKKLVPFHPLGYKDGQLMIGFAHNTPDNSLPIFWCEGHQTSWSPVFIRFQKQ